MLKTLLIPLINLAVPDEGCFFKFFIEPLTDNCDDGFASIAHGALELAVTQARAAQKTLPESTCKSGLRLITPDADLSSSAGAALGLALSPLYLLPECPYQHFIVTGTLDFSTPAISVGDSGALPEKMVVVSHLGYQVQPTVLIMPSIKPNDNIKDIYQILAKQNIAVRTVNTLEQACLVCVGGWRTS